ncbi:MAG: transglycosylase domain-containing protein [Clostridia bacterium]|nr:transglycosylase domain-containing protein [Clostridia bacterium]
MKRNHGKRFGRIVLAFFLVIVFCAVMLTSSFVIYATQGIDASLDLEMLTANQGRTTKLYYYDGDGNAVELENERLHGAENRIWIPLFEIPKDVQNAFIAIEDHRFYEHQGVDFRRTAGAVLGFASGGGLSYGGSTITQQLIKNLTGDNKVTVKRKLTEIMRALHLEKEVSKETILELYLNTVYLAEGCYGLETAAELYFGKTASELTLVEGATLAAIIQYPTRYDPIQNPTYNKERRNTILWRMHELGLLEDDVYEEAIHTETELHLGTIRESEKKLSWFTEVVIEDVIHDLSKAYHLSRTAASQMLYNGGLSVYTTMDAKMQEAVEAYYANVENIPKSKEGVRASSSTVLIDPKNGHLLAVAGDIGEKTSDRIFNLATQMLRSPGSVIKPVSVYAPALEKDLITWASVFDDVPVSFTKNGNTYTAWPKNNPRIYSGLTTVNTALMKSTNTVAVRVLKKLGENNSYRFLKSLGITTLVEYEKSGNGKTFSDIAAAPLALGATTRGVSVREMTGAYTMLANGEGIHHDTVSYTKVYDKDGNLILSNETEGTRAISKDTADIMTRLLKNVVTYGTASDMTLSRSVPVAGKTGTSNANTDRWFIGYTPDLLCGVWYGHKDARDIGTHKINPAVTIFDGLMSRLYAKNAAETITLNKKNKFPTSENVISALYCKDSGKAPAYACSHDLRGHRVILGYFKKGTEPRTACDEHILLDYDKEAKTLASEKCPEENRLRVAFVKGYARSFPCQIHVLDAEFMYRHLPFGASPTLDPTKAFFQNYYEKNGNYIGVSGAEKAHNRYCTEYETTVEETTTADILTENTETHIENPAENTTSSKKNDTSAPPETTEIFTETEETTTRKHLVPWW